MASFFVKVGAGGPTYSGTLKQTSKANYCNILSGCKKQRYSTATIKLNQSCLRALLKRDTKLLDPESVKEAIAEEKAWGENRKRNIINA